MVTAMDDRANCMPHYSALATATTTSTTTATTRPANVEYSPELDAENRRMQGRLLTPLT